MPTNLVELEKIRIGIVNYLNTRPLLYGLRQPPFGDQITISLDYPSRIALQLKNKDIDLGLVPVALLKEYPHLQRIGSHCIATDNEIGSVCLFSQVPLAQIRTILLDYQSRTSVALIRILVKHHWKISATFQETTGDEYIKRIGAERAGLVIGDRALQSRADFAYCYDLGSAWKEMTGLPFVFAAWFSTHALSTEFIMQFTEANQLGLDHLSDIVPVVQPATSYDLMHYFTQNVQYQWRSDMQESLRLFLELAE